MALGNRTEQRGYALLLVLLVTAAAAATAAVLVPKRLTRIAADRAEVERRALERIREGLLKSIRFNLAIPDRESWSATVAHSTGMNLDAVQSVDPRFAVDATTHRLYLVDPGLGSGLLPYIQGDSGLTGSATNLLGDHARIMLLSTSRRGVALPVDPTTISQAQFDALWDWAPNPTAPEPPPDWPAEWARHARTIHVARIPLHNLFARVDANSLVMGIGSSLLPASNISLGSVLRTATSRWLLKGSLIRIVRLPAAGSTLDLLLGSTLDLTLGSVLGAQMSLVIERDQVIDFSVPQTGPVPLLYYPFRATATSLTTVTNEGSLGAAWNGWRVDEAYGGAVGPIPPTFAGFSTNNRCLDLSRSSGYVRTNGRLPSKLPRFTLAGWIRPTDTSLGTDMAFGFPRQLQIGIHTRWNGTYLFAKSRHSGSILAEYPYSLNTWHHVALVGDGHHLRLYLDGNLIGDRRRFSLNYGRRRGAYFRIGNTNGWWMGRFRGYVDDVVLLDEALTPTQVQTLATGDIGSVCNLGSGT